MLQPQPTKEVIYLWPKHIRSNWSQFLKKWKQERVENHHTAAFIKKAFVFKFVLICF